LVIIEEKKYTLKIFKRRRAINREKAFEFGDEQ